MDEGRHRVADGSRIVLDYGTAESTNYSFSKLFYGIPLAILSLVGCFPVGLLAVLYALSAILHYRLNDFAEAKRMMQTSAWISLGSAAFLAAFAFFSIMLS